MNYFVFKITMLKLFIFFTFSHFSLPNCYLPFLYSFFSFFHSPHFFTFKAMIFYTKTVVFISDSMTMISYLRSSPGLHFYIVFLAEEHTKVVIFISKLCECRFVFYDFWQYKSLNFFILFSNFSQYLRYCMQRRWKNTKAVIFISKKLRFLSQTDLFFCFSV